MNWKHILLKNIQGSKFKNTITIKEEDSNKKFQVFEVLVTETLARMDTKTIWHTVPVGKDDGIDFVGTREPINNPYLNYAPQLVLGQVKRRTDGYRADSFRYDIVKIVDHFEQKQSQAYSLVEIIHVISSDKNVDFNTLINSLSYNYRHYHIMPINATDFFQYWSINPTMILSLLEDVFSKSDLLQLIMDFSATQHCLNKSLTITGGSHYEGYIGEKAICQYELRSDIDLSINLYARIEFNEDFKKIVDVCFPKNIIKKNTDGFRFALFHEYKLSICFLPYKIYTGEMGILNICTETGSVIQTIQMGTITINNAFTPLFFPEPNSKILTALKKEVISVNSCCFFSIIGTGGAGKSALIKEAMLTAQNRDYDCATIAHPHNHIQPRKIIYELFMFLVNQDSENMPLYEQAYELIWEYLGCNAQPYWSPILMDYFTNEKNVDLNILLEIIIVLFIIKTSSTAIFIWFSDMHWSDTESLQLLWMLVDKMQHFKSYFSNNIILLFEGRDNECIKIQNSNYYPEEWNNFIKNTLIQPLALETWTYQQSYDYLDLLINTKKTSSTIEGEKRKRKFINNILKYAKGNPFHINEIIKHLYENKYLDIDELGYLYLPNIMVPSDIKTSYVGVIQLRIDFYKKRFSNLLDIFILLCNMSEYNRYSFYQYAIKKMKNLPENIKSVLHDMNFISIERNKITFQHEFYYQVLKETTITDLNNIYFAKKWYNRHAPFYNPSDIISLNMLLDEPNENEIIHCMQNILKNQDERCKLEAYYSSLQFSYFLLKKLNLTHAEIYYEIGIILIKIGDWQEAEKIFHEILIMHSQESSVILFKILARKQLANIYGIHLQLDRSVQTATEALKMVTYYIKNFHEYNINKKYLKELERQEILVLSRLAVSYWFSGQIELAIPLYEQALLKAQAINDIYSISHTLYEQGMCVMHKNAASGLKLIEQGLQLFPGRAAYTSSHEYDLICVEKFIGIIKLWSESDECSFPNKIVTELETICRKLGVGISNYESALCHMLNGIRYIYEENYQEAIDCFYTSIDCCKMSNLEVVLWKNYLNIAQIYQFLSDTGNGIDYNKAQAKYYAGLAEIILKQTKTRNPETTECLESLYLLPMEVIYSVLKGHAYIMHNEWYKDNKQIPIYIKINHFMFFIMD